MAKPGEQLVEYLSGSPGAGAVPRFSFYSSLVEEMLSHGRHLGAPLKVPLNRLKQDLQHELRWRKKLSAAIVGGYFQFILAFLIAWVFMYIGQKMVEREMPGKIMSVFLIQGVGFVFFWVMDKFIRALIFKNFSLLYKNLMTFHCLSQVSLSQEVILAHVDMRQIHTCKTRWSQPILWRFEAGLRRWRDEGRGISELLNEILIELQFLWQERFELYLKLLNGSKFFCLSFFFLGSYLYFLYSFGQLFLIE
ncbi:MAG: hypothetical protein HOM21_08145 [Halobacteriovoraceae bacterium]|nr:hypothetical protein [Halobacteriovoraceae bacterium]